MPERDDKEIVPMSEIESGVWSPVKTTFLPWYGEDETNAAGLLVESRGRVNRTGRLLQDIQGLLH